MFCPLKWSYLCAVSTSSYPVLTHKLRTYVRDLQRASERDARRCFVVEGVRACEELLAGTLAPNLVVMRAQADERTQRTVAAFVAAGAPVFEASERHMDMMCDTRTPQAMLAVVDFPEVHPLGTHAIVLDGLRDPGNAGTIIRTCAWFGFSDVVFLDNCVDPFHPKVVRSAVGSLAHVNVVRDAVLPAVLHEWNDRGPIVATTVSGGIVPSALESMESALVLVGSEADGLSAVALNKSAITVTIPRYGHAESLNAAIAASIVCYEIKRGR